MVMPSALPSTQNWPRYPKLANLGEFAGLKMEGFKRPVLLHFRQLGKTGMYLANQEGCSKGNACTLIRSLNWNTRSTIPKKT